MMDNKVKQSLLEMGRHFHLQPSIYFSVAMIFRGMQLLPVLLLFFFL
jgi:hypothetical protein